MNDYKIREIAFKDNADLKELIRYNLKSHGLDIPGTVYFDAVLDNLYEFYSGSETKGYYVLVDSEDKVVGGIGFEEFLAFDSCAELQKLYLADSVKGQGLGYTLIKYVEDKMMEKGFKSSYLETHHNLEAAIHIYKKSGYRLIERPENVAHGAMDHFFYKELV